MISSSLIPHLIYMSLYKPAYFYLGFFFFSNMGEVATIRNLNLNDNLEITIKVWLEYNPIFLKSFY